MAAPSSGNAHRQQQQQKRFMPGYATLAQLGQRRLSLYRTLIPFMLLVLAYVFMESFLRVNIMLISQQDRESQRRTFGNGFSIIDDSLSMFSSKVPMHTCRVGDQILSMPEKLPGFLIVRFVLIMSLACSLHIVYSGCKSSHLLHFI
jgi:hypothetical protein